MSKIPKAHAESAPKALSANQARLLSKPEVCDKVGRTFPTIWKMMRRRQFPLARDLAGRPMWIESEVDEWIAALPARVYKAAD